jgi:hypothetical protein
MKVLYIIAGGEIVKEKLGAIALTPYEIKEIGAAGTLRLVFLNVLNIHVPDNLSLHHIDHHLGDIGGVVGNPFEILRQPTLRMATPVHDSEVAPKMACAHRLQRPQG